MRCTFKLSIVVPEDVDPTAVEEDLAHDLVETSMASVEVLHDVSVGAVAEGSIRAVLAIADLVVAALAHVEEHRSVSGDQVVAQ